MEFSTTNIFWGCAVILITMIGTVHNAPKMLPAKYDQKQSGENNVQVHLKNFHIIAVLGDDVWGGDGDYDYNYDYSDLTIKPILPLTTENPQNSNASEPLNKPEADVEKPGEHKPDVIMSSSTSTTNPLPTIPVVVISGNPQPPTSSGKEHAGTNEKPENEKVSSTQKPGKPEQEPNEKKTESPVTNVSTVPPSSGSDKKINQNDQQVPRGGITRRCLQGFARDKQGRCRKIKRTPSISLGIARFATNLASRFRQATIEKMGVVWVTLIASILAVCQSSPVPHHRLKYDQRQEGKWNVRADLENFIILVIPTSSSGASNGSLLDFLSKTIPLPYYKKSKKHTKVHSQEDENLPNAEQFLESRKSPYSVDISRTRNHLAKLHPEVNVPENVKEEIIIARSPSVALAKSQESDEGKEKPVRNSRAILITVPMENENIQRHSIKEVVGGKGGEEIKKTLGMSIDAIEQGLTLAAETQKRPLKTFEIIPNKLDSLKDTSYDDNLKKIADEVKTVHAIVFAKTVHAGMKEKRQEKEKGGFKEESDKVVKVKEEDTLKMELQPPRMPEENLSKEPAEASKENSKDELLLLGAELEQSKQNIYILN
ncbi:hypothetical protein ILUMI_20853 [Ignelater luminosus]|uniref:Uncharacterized protein n=1 Tax=Ignelater luminosus TaxID=2038154 RepID=A0A8K0CGP7_IGNLU|nr:hypothetical protein ILUMI_20853 [Ignelater luminosus]